MAGSTGGMIWAWRDASKTSSDTAFRRIRTAMAVRLPPGATSREPSLDLSSSKGAASSSWVQLRSGETVSIVTAIGDNLQQGNGHDPLAATLAAAEAASASKIAMDVESWWRQFWAKSSISLPQSPTVEAFWAGSQYVLAAMNANAEMMDATNHLLPPGGSYGPWITNDDMGFPDYTMDYNVEATYYGVYASGHGEYASSYFPTVSAWVTGGQAQAAARMHALRGNLTCQNNSLHYSCHLAPWGYQSGDLSEYMHWNGNFAALLYINAWEYEQNETFARAQAYPLLDGLNAWWSCFLTKRVRPDGSYVYEDASLNNVDPDQEHENQNCTNPQIGVALVRRTFSAQLSMAKALGITPNPKYADILAHLVPLNAAVCGADGEPNVQTGAKCVPGQTLWMQCGAANSMEGDSRIKASDGYSLYGLYPAEIVQVGVSTEAEVQTARDSIAYYGLNGASWGLFGGGPGSIKCVYTRAPFSLTPRSLFFADAVPSVCAARCTSGR